MLPTLYQLIQVIIVRFSLIGVGEGIHDVYLRQYKNKEVTQEFEHYHFDDQPEEWLEAAKTKKFDSDTGLRFVGPSYFKPKTMKIPSWFHFFKTEDDTKKYLQDNTKEGEKVFVVTADLESPDTLLWIHTLAGKQKILRKDNTFEHQDTNTTGTLEDVIDKVMLKSDYKSV